jgi:uncharacterized protein (TIGR03435 family)
MILDPLHFPRPAPGEKRMTMCDIRMAANGPNRTLTATGAKISVPDMTGVAIPPFNRTVIDKAGLTGMFDFHLEFAPDDVTPGITASGDASDPPGPSIFAALQEQLGLKLEAGKGPGALVTRVRAGEPSMPATLLAPECRPISRPHSPDPIFTSGQARTTAIAA